jgi:hypothetical protein
LEKLAADKSVLIAVAPVADDTGVVIDESVDPELLQKVREQFANIEGIRDVKTIFALGAKVRDVTVIHENHHVEDIRAGLLPLSTAAKDRLISDLNNALRTSGDATQADVDLIQEWLVTMNRSAPEISAIQAEYQYLLSQKRTQTTKFSDYLLASDHDFIAKHGGITEMRAGWEQTGDKKFLTSAKEICCRYFESTLTSLKISSASFSELFPVCGRP